MHFPAIHYFKEKYDSTHNTQEKPHCRKICSDLIWVVLRLLIQKEWEKKAVLQMEDDYDVDDIMKKPQEFGIFVR